MTFSELPIIAAPSQAFDTVLSGRSCRFDVHHNARTNRWSFDLAIDGETVLTGRRIVTGGDLLQPFGLDIGALYAVDWDGKGVEPGLTELPAGLVRLIHDDGQP